MQEETLMCEKCEVRNPIKRRDIVVRTDQGACHVTKYVVLSVRDGLCGPVAVVAPADVIGRNSYKFTISVACLDKVYSKNVVNTNPCSEISEPRGYKFKVGDKGKDLADIEYEVVHVDPNVTAGYPMVVKKNNMLFFYRASGDHPINYHLLPPTVTQYVTTYLNSMGKLCSIVSRDELAHQQLLRTLELLKAKILDDKSYNIKKQ